MFEWSCRYGCIQGNLQQIKKEHVVFIFENFLRLTARMPINIFDDLQILFVKPKNFHEITPPPPASFLYYCMIVCDAGFRSRPVLGRLRLRESSLRLLVKENKSLDLFLNWLQIV